MSRRGIALLLLATAVCLIAGLSAGTVPLSPSDIWAGLRSSDAPASVIVRELRAPGCFSHFSSVEVSASVVPRSRR